MMLADLAKGDIGAGKGSMGSRAHKHLKDTIDTLNKNSVFRNLNLRVEAEIFRLPDDKEDYQNQRKKGSLGLDVVKYRGSTKVLAFDLKTGRGWSKNSVNKRRSRFGGIDVVEIFVNKK